MEKEMRKFKLRNGIVIGYPFKHDIYNVKTISTPANVSGAWKQDEGTVLIIEKQADGWFRLLGGAHGIEFDAMEEIK